MRCRWQREAPGPVIVHIRGCQNVREVTDSVGRVQARTDSNISLVLSYPRGPRIFGAESSNSEDIVTYDLVLDMQGGENLWRHEG